MKHLLLATLLLVAQLFCAVAQPQQLSTCSNPSEAFCPERLSLIDSVFQKIVDEQKLPQVVTLVAHRGEIVHHKAYGWRDMEQKIPCQRDDIFRIASQTKAIAAVALMTLWEEGKFQLDDPIKKYIPEFANPVILEKYDRKTGTYTTRPTEKDITIRHLLTHTSGISYQGVHWDIAKRAGVPPLNSLDNVTLEQMVKRMAKLPLAHEPGEKFTYSMNIDVLGYLMEILTRKTIDVFLKERIFDPIGMTDTYFYLPQDKVERLVRLYEFPKNGTLRLSQNELNQTFPYAGAQTLHCTGAGLSGTISDYAHFCQMVLNGGTFNGKRIIGRKTLELMQRNAVGNMRGEIGFGMAWDVFLPEFAHKSIISTGSMRWGGMFGTDYVIDPSEELIILIYTNCMPNFNGIKHKDTMHNLVYGALR